MSDLNNEIFDAVVEAAQALIQAKENGWTYTHYQGERRMGTNSSITFKKDDLTVYINDLNNISRDLFDAEDRKANPDNYDLPPYSIEKMNEIRKLFKRSPLNSNEEKLVTDSIEDWKQRNPHRKIF